MVSLLADALDKESISMYLESQIEMMKILSEYHKESKLENISSVLYEEDETDKKETKETKSVGSSIATFIRKVWQAIAGALAAFFNKLGGKAEGLTIDQYLNSRTGEIQMSYDIEKIEKKIEEEKLKGNKLIQAISKGTGVSDTQINDYIQGCAKFMNEKGKYVVSAAIAPAVYAILVKRHDDANAQKNKSGVYNTVSKEGEGKITKIMNAMHSMVNFGTAVASNYFAQFDKLQKKDQKD